MTQQPFLIDAGTTRAVRAFLERIGRLYPLDGAFLFGSRARGDYDKYSDADLAVLLNAPSGDALETGVAMAAIAFDVLLDTEILVSPLPIWKEEWAHPETHSNPRLLENIRREGISL
jgi:predicted nucleotidyltransferase